MGGVPGALTRCLWPNNFHAPNDFTLRISQPYANLVQSRMRTLWLDAQQIAALQMIGEIIHAHVECFLGGEKIHIRRRSCPPLSWECFPHGLPRVHDLAQDIDAGRPLVFVGGLGGVVLLGKIWREGQREHNHIALADRSDYVVNFRAVAAMVARLADQQQHALAFLWSTVEQFDE